MSKARTLADFISDGSEFADGTISVAEVSGAAPLASPTFTGTASGTFSGPLTGNVTGDVTGDLTGDVTGNVTGNLTGNVTGDVAGDIDLSAISSTISDTAVDVFVYDTRKDSDGGAWRKRTQHTSWYNETLNTATRGSRKEFPAVAVIVAHDNQVTIYDGDDPDLPMWMVFLGDGNTSWMAGGTDFCLAAMNGILCAGGKSTNQRLRVVEFVHDGNLDYATTSTGALRSSGQPVSQRNNTYGFSITLDSSIGIVNRTCNDIDMTVLPNAPIDAATGLPVPTIAVATGGGISVIRDDGTVTDSAASNAFNHISANEDGFAYGYNSYENYVVVSYEATATDSWSPDIINVYYGGSGGMSPLATSHSSTNATDALAAYSQGNNIGLTNWDVKRGGGAYEKLFNYTTSSYNTGWMNGDIKLAALSDTDDTNVTGSELVTNGTFDSNITGWTDDSDGGGSISWNSSGYLNVTYTSGTARALQTITTEVGKKYTYTVNVISEVGNGYIYAGVSGNSGGLVQHQITSTGVKSFTFTATSTATQIRISNFGVGTTTVDNISVRLAEEDRSVNGNGLQVFGTVTKSAVATGADLVAYSGFSTSNFLKRPANSDLAFGNGSFSVMGWFKGGDDTQVLCSFGSGSQVFDVRIHTDDKILTQVTDDTFATRAIISGQGPSVVSDVWKCIVIVRQNNKLIYYLNGDHIHTSSAVEANLTNDMVLHLGAENSNGAKAVTGSMALWRVSGTAPSPEQIKKIYEDEKFLFQDNAQATLYGSSDAVTALAYDDSTDLLHVGTSAGRSVFQGLRRVDNTTDAVGAAISASNGLVADE